MEDAGGKLGSAGSLWQDPLAIALTPSKLVSAGSHGSRGGNGRSQVLSVAFVFTEDLTELLPLRCLKDACREIPTAELTVLPFGTVALGDMGALDSFYNAGESRRSSRGLKQSNQKRGPAAPGRQTAHFIRCMGACIHWESLNT